MSYVTELNCRREKVVAHLSQMYSMRFSTPVHVNRYFITQKKVGNRTEKVRDKTVLGNVSS